MHLRSLSAADLHSVKCVLLFVSLVDYVGIEPTCFSVCRTDDHPLQSHSPFNKVAVRTTFIFQKLLVSSVNLEFRRVPSTLYTSRLTGAAILLAYDLTLYR